jgi:hypothetical protein
MENQIINEEFRKTQKLSELLTEEMDSFVWDDIKDDYLKPKKKFKFKGGKVKVFGNGNIVISDRNDYGESGEEVEFTKQEAKDLLEVLKQILG